MVLTEYDRRTFTRFDIKVVAFDPIKAEFDINGEYRVTVSVSKLTMSQKITHLASNTSYSRIKTSSLIGSIRPQYLIDNNGKTEQTLPKIFHEFAQKNLPFALNTWLMINFKKEQLYDPFKNQLNNSVALFKSPTPIRVTAEQYCELAAQEISVYIDQPQIGKLELVLANQMHVDIQTSNFKTVVKIQTDQERWIQVMIPHKNQFMCVKQMNEQRIGLEKDALPMPTIAYSELARHVDYESLVTKTPIDKFSFLNVAAELPDTILDIIRYTNLEAGDLFAKADIEKIRQLSMTGLDDKDETKKIDTESAMAQKRRSFTSD